jgi:multidrug efflux pump subunit AcrA (membrane-fusion protein)
MVKTLRWRTLILLGGGFAALGSALGPDLYLVRRARGALDDTPVAPVTRRATIAARGRLQPRGGVLRVAGPNQPGAVIGTLYVHEGDWVAAGTVLAVLEGTASLRAAVRRLEAEAQHAATELRRCRQLFRDRVISTAERDAAQVRADVAQAELLRARAELDTSSVRSPIAGRVLTVHTHAGERIGSAGVLDLGDTAHMEVVAEVYESDVGGVYVGQPATVTASALAAPLTGAVERVGLTIGKQSVFDINPAADTDARVIEVHIRLDESAAAAALTNLQVDVDLAA